MKELTKVKISDTFTHNLVNGILVIIKTHSNSSVTLGSHQNVVIDISDSSAEMTREDIKVLEDWGWRRYYYHNIEKLYWTYESRN
jgi:hypothetical protein